jgi:hypothetical protein
VRQGDLAVVLQDVRVGALQDAGRASSEAGGVLAEGFAAASGFDADQLNFLIFTDEVVENSDRVRAAADAGDDGGGQFAFGFRESARGLRADDAVEVADHGGIGMRA